MIGIETFSIGPLETNCHVIYRDGKAAAVDPGGEPDEILELLGRKSLTLTHILNTHLHFDHIYGNRELSEKTGAPILVPVNDVFLLQDGLGAGGWMGFPRVAEFVYQTIEPGEYVFAGLNCEVLPTPGHTPGSLSFYFPQADAIFTGDVIFYRSIGRTDFPGGDYDTLINSIKTRIFPLPDETAIYNGHGLDTSVGHEKAHNPFINRMMM